MNASEFARWRGATRVGLVTVLVMAFAGPAAAEPDEYSLKAAYLYNFVKYMDWPEQAFSDADSSYRICVVGHDPFGGRLEIAVAGKQIKGRGVEIRREPALSTEQLRTCHIAFLDSSEARLVPRLLAEVQGTHVATVGELQGFAEQGGIANFAKTDTGFVVELNVEAGRRAGLRIGARLQQIARIVEGKGEVGR